MQEDNKLKNFAGAAGIIMLIVCTLALLVYSTSRKASLVTVALALALLAVVFVFGRWYERNELVVEDRQE